MRISPAGRASAELASQRPTVAVVGKNRTRGSWRSPQEASAWRCWSPNSIRPLLEFAGHDAHLGVAGGVSAGGVLGSDGRRTDRDGAGDNGEQRRRGGAPQPSGTVTPRRTTGADTATPEPLSTEGLGFIVHWGLRLWTMRRLRHDPLQGLSTSVTNHVPKRVLKRRARGEPQ